LGADDVGALEVQIYQAILERRPAPMISRLQEILAQSDSAFLGFAKGELQFWLGWAQEVGGDPNAARESWLRARRELEPLLREQPENYSLIGDLALINMGLGEKAAALTLAERAIAANPVAQDAVRGPIAIEILARVAARLGEPDRAVAVLEKLLSTPYAGAMAASAPHACVAPSRSDVRCAPRRSAVRQIDGLAGRKVICGGATLPGRRSC